MHSATLNVMYDYIVRDHSAGWCSGVDASEDDDDFYKGKGYEYGCNILKIVKMDLHPSHVYRNYNGKIYLKSHLLGRLSYITNKGCTSSGSGYCTGFGKKYYTAKYAIVVFDDDDDEDMGIDSDDDEETSQDDLFEFYSLD